MSGGAKGLCAPQCTGSACQLEARLCPSHFGGRRIRVAEAMHQAKQVPWHRLLSRPHWRLTGHLARMPVGSVCHDCIRDGGLWHAYTLRALCAGGVYLRQGTQRRMDDGVYRFCHGHGCWWVHAAGSREVWRHSEEHFVNNLAPLSRWGREVRETGRIRNQPVRGTDDLDVEDIGHLQALSPASESISTVVPSKACRYQ